MYPSLSDSDYLSFFCNWRKQYHSSHVYTILNNADEFIAYSSNIMSLINDDKIIGKKIRELNSPLASYAEEYSKASQLLNRITIDKPVMIEYLIVFNNTKNITLWQHFTSKIINPATGTNLGTYTNANRINPDRLLVGVLNESTKRMVFVNSQNNINFEQLSAREHELLFLIALGKTRNEIATILSIVYQETIKSQTITTWINRYLYPKFNTNSMSGLVEKTYSLGLLDVIPLSFMPLLNNEVIF